MDTNSEHLNENDLKMPDTSLDYAGNENEHFNNPSYLENLLNDNLESHNSSKKRKDISAQDTSTTKNLELKHKIKETQGSTSKSQSHSPEISSKMSSIQENTRTEDHEPLYVNNASNLLEVQLDFQDKLNNRDEKPTNLQKKMEHLENVSENLLETEVGVFTPKLKKPKKTEKYESSSDKIVIELDQSISDPRLDSKQPTKNINANIRQSFSTVLADINFKFDGNSVGKPEKSSVFVTGIPLSTTYDDLEMLLKQFGRIYEIDYPTCPLFNKHLGIAKVSFGDGFMKSSESAFSALSIVKHQDSLFLGESKLHIKLDTFSLLYQEALKEGLQQSKSSFESFVHFNGKLTGTNAMTNSDFSRSNPFCDSDRRNSDSNKTSVLDKGHSTYNYRKLSSQSEKSTFSKATEPLFQQGDDRFNLKEPLNLVSEDKDKEADSEGFGFDFNLGQSTSQPKTSKRASPGNCVPATENLPQLMGVVPPSYSPGNEPGLETKVFEKPMHFLNRTHSALGKKHSDPQPNQHNPTENRSIQSGETRPDALTEPGDLKLNQSYSSPVLGNPTQQVPTALTSTKNATFTENDPEGNENLSRKANESTPVTDFAAVGQFTTGTSLQVNRESKFVNPHDRIDMVDSDTKSQAQKVDFKSSGGHPDTSLLVNEPETKMDANSALKSTIDLQGGTSNDIHSQKEGNGIGFDKGHFLTNDTSQPKPALGPSNKLDTPRHAPERLTPLTNQSTINTNQTTDISKQTDVLQPQVDNLVQTSYFKANDTQEKMTGSLSEPPSKANFDLTLNNSSVYEALNPNTDTKATTSTTLKHPNGQGTPDKNADSMKAGTVSASISGANSPADQNGHAMQEYSLEEDFCLVIENKYLPFFLASETDLFHHFASFAPIKVIKERMCWVVIFKTEQLAKTCCVSPVAKSFRGFHLVGKVQSLFSFKNPGAKPSTQPSLTKTPPTHHSLPSTGLPSFKKFTNAIRPTANKPSTAADLLSTLSNKRKTIGDIPKVIDDGLSSSSEDDFTVKLLQAKEINKSTTNLQPNKALTPGSPRPSNFSNRSGKEYNSNKAAPQSKSHLKQSNGNGCQNQTPPDFSLHGEKRAKITNGTLEDKLYLFHEEIFLHHTCPTNSPHILPVHPTGSARTEGFYKLPDELKKFRLKYEPPVLKVQTISGIWKPYSASARIAQSHLDEGSSNIRLAQSGIHDWGLFTTKPIVKGELVIEYVGELIRSNLADVRERSYLEKGIDSSYLFRVDDEYVVDATVKGNIARFINHSCMPNCYAKITRSEPKPRILIFAKHDIPINEEITYDYQFPIEEDNKIRCLCNTSACRGYLN